MVAWLVLAATWVLAAFVVAFRHTSVHKMRRRMLAQRLAARVGAEKVADDMMRVEKKTKAQLKKEAEEAEDRKLEEEEARNRGGQAWRRLKAKQHVFTLDMTTLRREDGVETLLLVEGARHGFGRGEWTAGMGNFRSLSNIISPLFFAW